MPGKLLPGLKKLLWEARCAQIRARGPASCYRPIEDNDVKIGGAFCPSLPAVGVIRVIAEDFR